MSPTTAALILSWVAIALLSVGLAGMLRVLRLHDVQLRRQWVAPHRVRPGDKLSIPHHVGEPSQHGVGRVILFGKPECGRCVRAHGELASMLSSSQLGFASVWRGTVPRELRSEPNAHGDQLAAFEAVGADLLPFGIVIEADGTVTSAGAIGSSTQLAEFAAAAQQSGSPRAASGAEFR